MTQVGPTLTPTGSDGGDFSNPWTSPTNIQATDAAFATVVCGPGTDVTGGGAFNSGSNSLVSGGWSGSLVPAGSTIDGAQVDVKGKCSTGTAAIRVSMHNFAYTSNALGVRGITLTTTNTVFSVGGSTDKWATDDGGSNLTAANINAGSIAWIMARTGYVGTISIDSVTVTIWYTPPGGGPQIKVTRQAVMRAARR